MEERRTEQAGWSRQVARALGWVLALGLLGWVASRLGGALAALPKLACDPRWLGLSLLGLFGAIALGCEGWRRWVVAAGAPLGYRAAFRVLYQANLAKYLPGGAWHFVGRVALAAREGVPAPVATLAMAMDVVAHLAGALLFLVVVGAVTGAVPPVGLLVPGLAILVGLHPRVLDVGFAVLARLRRREATRVGYGYGTVVAQVALYFADWCLIAAGFAALARSLSPVPVGGAAAWAAAGGLATAWTAGALAVFAPAGLGVREAALTVLLAPYFPPGVPAALALASRAWFVAGELVAFCLALVWRAAPSRSRY